MSELRNNVEKKQKNIEWNKKYYEKNKKAINNKNKEHYHENKERILLKMKLKYHENKQMKQQIKMLMEQLTLKTEELMKRE